MITVQQQYDRLRGCPKEETKFDSVYKIQIHNMTLRELLILESISVCQTQTEILSMVLEQPSAQLFFKSFLELNSANMVSILSFDSRAMKSLLAPSNKHLFKDEFPLIYKNKI